MNSNFAAIILGGTGQVGRAAVTELLAIPECREVVDDDLRRARLARRFDVAGLDDGLRTAGGRADHRAGQQQR